MLSGVGDLKAHLGALGAADPIALHLLDVLRPVQIVQIVQQALGVGGDLQHPLTHAPALDGLAGVYVHAVDHLLVRQHRALRWAPPHRNLRPVGQAALVQLQEDPLAPAVVVLVAGVDLALPVEREAQALQLLLEAPDVLGGDVGGVAALADGVALGGQPEGVPADGIQHVETPQALVPGDDIDGGVAQRVTQMQAGARRVREHAQGVELRAIVGGRGGERPLLGPAGLPAGLDLLGVVAAHGLLRVGAAI